VFQADRATSGREHYMESWDTTECPSPPCAAGEDDPANDWVRVSLEGHAVGTYETDTITNTDLIGTRVSLSSGPAVWIQSEAGSSSGVGIPLSFGYSGTQTLEVLWPNGHTTSHAVSANSSYELLDQSVPYVKDSSLQVTKTFGVGTVTLDIDWKSVGPCTADRVVITHVSGGGYCSDYATTLNRTAAQSQTQTSFNEYEHEVTWSNRDCHAKCTFDVQVYSDNPVASSWSSKERVKINSCIGGI